MSVKFKFEKRLNAESKFADVKPVTRKKFYVVGQDEKGKSFLGNIDNATLIEARNEGKSWAKKHGLKFQGVFSN